MSTPEQERKDRLRRERRGLESELVLVNTILEAVEEALEGKEPRDFMQSFGVVRKVFDTQQHNEWLEAHIEELKAKNEKLRLVTEALVEKVEKGILSLESRGIEGHNEALFWHNLIHDLKQALKGEGNE